MTHKPHLFENFPHYFKSLGKILHYTCNAPSENYLLQNGLRPRGEEFNSDITEVVEIPLDKYKKFGYRDFSNKDLLKLNCEKIMRDLSNKERLKKKKLGEVF